MLRTAVGIIVVNGRTARRVGVGDSVTMGRSQTCDIRLPDAHISRRACLLRVEPDYVMVFNQSIRRPLAIRPPAGEDRRVGPASATTSLPYTTFDIIFAGADDEPVRVHIDARRLSSPELPAVDPAEEQTCDVTVLGPMAEPAGRMQAALLTRAQRIALIAMCEPMLTRNGTQARPRSTTELAERLNLKPDYARNIIKDVRHRLADAGVPGLVSADGTATGRIDLRLALARWAIERDAVTVGDLDDLPGQPKNSWIWASVR
jgi:hypothetical protein